MTPCAYDLYHIKFSRTNAKILFRKFRSEITLIEARFNNPFDRLNAGLENAFLGSYHTDNDVRRGGKFMTYMPFKQCHLASINLKISLNAYFT